MSTKEKIEYLASICKEDVTIFINNIHRAAGETIRDYLHDNQYEVSEDVIDEMESLNLMIEVIAYPGSQVGSYRYVHFDLDVALDKVIQECKEYHKIS